MRASFVVNVVFLALIAGGIYYYRSEVKTFAVQAVHQIAPCASPITYSIGSIDPRFGISTSTLEKSLQSAEDVWERASKRDLFVYVPAGGLVSVNLVYDSRQATALRLKELGLSVQDNAASYDAVKARYQSSLSVFTERKRAFEVAYASYEKDVRAYEAEVSQWNARGGAPQSVYQRLQSQKARLDEEATQIQALERSVNVAADDVNTLVEELNRLARALNLDVSKYNTVGDSTPAEFEQGIFESAPGKESITIYEYDSLSKLTRVLAHEFGHSLGLEHVDDTKAIMYRLNQNANLAPTDADVQELARVCGAA